MKRMLFAVVLAAFVCCSWMVLSAEFIWEQAGMDTVPELLKHQVSYDELQWKLAKWYNLNLTSDWQDPGFEGAYGNILDLHEHAMGYITVPSEGIALPICHGAGKGNDAGHIHTTAFPIGGMGTHSALTGDFSLDTGDCFYIHILGQVRPYRITETVTVANDSLTFPAEESEELCTLVSTGPLGMLRLMRGSYWEEAPEEGTIRVEERAETDGWLIAACITLALGILLVPLAMWCRQK